MMKKLFVITLALSMMVSAMSLGASATYTVGGNNFNVDNATDNSNNAGQLAGDEGKGIVGEEVGNKEIVIKLQTGQAGKVTHVYAVSYSATDLTFEYGNAADKIWNPETLRYETMAGTGGGWQNEGKQSITVTNYSDLKVKVTPDVTEDSTDAGVTISVTEEGLALESAAPVNMNDQGVERTGTIDVTLTGAPLGVYEQATKIGVVTLTVTNNET